MAKQNTKRIEPVVKKTRQGNSHNTKNSQKKSKPARKRSRGQGKPQ